MFNSKAARKSHPDASQENGTSREELLKEVFKAQNTLKLDGARLREERDTILQEVRTLEEQSHTRARRIRELQLHMFDRRKTAQLLFQRSEELKKRLVHFLVGENNLVHEIRFLESERDSCDKNLRDVSQRVNANMASIAALLRDIEFMRGEMEVLMDKTGALEGGVPNTFRDIDSLDTKISDALQALGDLYEKLRAVEKNTQRIYYRKEKG